MTFTLLVPLFTTFTSVKSLLVLSLKTDNQYKIFVQHNFSCKISIIKANGFK